MDVAITTPPIETIVPIEAIAFPGWRSPLRLISNGIGDAKPAVNRLPKASHIPLNPHQLNFRRSGRGG